MRHSPPKLLTNQLFQLCRTAMQTAARFAALERHQHITGTCSYSVHCLAKSMVQKRSAKQQLRILLEFLRLRQSRVRPCRAF